jgi:hypothetical protein
MENNELLHLFMTYLKSENSIWIMHFYLKIKDIIKSYDDFLSLFSNQILTEQNQQQQQQQQHQEENVVHFSQFKELEIWSNDPFNKKILNILIYENGLNYYNKLASLISEASSVDSFQIKTELTQINNKLFNLIKETYYSTFIKSDYVYKYLIGLNKNQSIKSTSQSSFTQNNDKQDQIKNNSPSKQSTPIEHPSETTAATSNESNFRIDLMNEINYEFFDEDTTSVNNNNNNNENKKINTDQDDNDVNHNKYEDDEDENDDNNNNNDNDNDDDNDNYNQNDAEPEPKDDDDDYTTNNTLLNHHLRVCIDEIEELKDKSNKLCYVFVIQVWSLQPMSANQNNTTQKSPTWCVKRKYDEFYVLDSKLKEFHGDLTESAAATSTPPVNNNLVVNNSTNQILMAQLPSKQRTIAFFGNNSKNLQFLDSVKNDFAKYLQSLLTNPILSMSQLLRSFLDPQSIEFGSSMFNDITNLGKMVKGVPYKLRMERGQSLDSFLISLTRHIKSKPNKPAKNMEKINETSITELKLNNKLFINDEKKHTRSHFFPRSNKTDDSIEDQVYKTPFETFYYLSELLIENFKSNLKLIFHCLKSNLSINYLHSFVYSFFH